MSIRNGRLYDIYAHESLGRVHVRIGRQAATLSVEEATDLRACLEEAVRKAVETEARIRAAYLAARKEK